MARRISSSGRVTVSERRSIRSCFMSFLTSKTKGDAHRSLDHVGLLDLDGDLGEEQVERDAAVDHAARLAVLERSSQAGFQASFAAYDPRPHVGREHREPLAEEKLGAVLV